jgi:hypothetical protein
MQSARATIVDEKIASSAYPHYLGEYCLVPQIWNLTNECMVGVVIML